MTWEATIRTGDPNADRISIEQHRQHAAAQGMALIEMPLAGGGFQVRAVPPANAYVQHPYAQSAQPYPNAQANPYAAPIAAAPAPVAHASGCQLCGAHAPTKQVTLLQNIGLVFARLQRQTTGQLCRACLRDVGLRYTLVTFFFGWWGVLSFFFSLFIVPANLFTVWSARSLGAPVRGPAKSLAVTAAVLGAFFALVYVVLMIGAIATLVDPPRHADPAGNVLVMVIVTAMLAVPSGLLLWFGVRGLGAKTSG